VAYLNTSKKIDEMGGVLPAIEEGYIQREIQESAYNYQLEIEKNERIIVGVNKFTIDEPQKKSLQKVTGELEAKQVVHLKELKEKRDNNVVKTVLEELAVVAKSQENLLPHILKAVKAYATVGEICDVFRNIYGEFKPKVTI
jgi:methylmalonyl-CoA mutase N-terminal domain/subunit